MAVLENIRQKGGVIIIITIGVALLAFLIGDFVPGRGGNNFDIAEVAGESVVFQEYEQKVDEINNMYRQQMGGTLSEQLQDNLREQAWRTLIGDKIMQQEFEKLDLRVSPEETFDMITGPNPNPIIRQYFSDPQTGEFNRTGLLTFLKNKNADPAASAEWNALERNLIKERQLAKYRSLIINGLFVPDFLANNRNIEEGKKADIDIVYSEYASIPDTTITVSDAEVKNYYAAHKTDYKQTTARDIEYVVINVVPSDEDRADAQKHMGDIVNEFASAADAMQYAKLNSRVAPDERFLTKGQLPVQIESLFDAEIGELVGPYEDGNALKASRLNKVVMRADSVHVRHIAVVPNANTQDALLAARALADSIYQALNNKTAKFADMAAKFSASTTAATDGGDIGWLQEEMLFGQPVAAVFDMKAGELRVIENPDGTSHVVEVLEVGTLQKKVQVATVQYDVLASSRTDQALYSKASKLAIENREYKAFVNAASEAGLQLRVATKLGENDRQVGGMTGARAIVRWAYEAKQGEVSDVFSLTDAYIVATLKNIYQEGYATLDQVYREVEQAVKREKKAETLKQKYADALASSTTITDLADKVGEPVDAADGVVFANFSVVGIGVEPAVIAASSMLPEGKLSEPIVGENGVYVINVKQVTEPDQSTIDAAKASVANSYQVRAMTDLTEALRKLAKVKDMRSKFY